MYLTAYSCLRCFDCIYFFLNAFPFNFFCIYFDSNTLPAYAFDFIYFFSHAFPLNFACICILFRRHWKSCFSYTYCPSYWAVPLILLSHKKKRRVLRTSGAYPSKKLAASELHAIQLTSYMTAYFHSSMIHCFHLEWIHCFHPEQLSNQLSDETS